MVVRTIDVSRRYREEGGKYICRLDAVSSYPVA